MQRQVLIAESEKAVAVRLLADAEAAAGLDAPITVADLAGEVRLSEGHFCRGFKVSTGETPHGFIVRRRLARAQHLMLTTDEPLSQVAMLCGMSDQAHLTRLFRRHLGTTPLTWRRTYRQEG